MIDCPECDGTGTETRERFMAGNVVEYYITCNNCKGQKQIEPMPEDKTGRFYPRLKKGRLER